MEPLSYLSPEQWPTLSSGCKGRGGGLHGGEAKARRMEAFKVVRLLTNKCSPVSIWDSNQLLPLFWVNEDDADLAGSWHGLKDFTQVLM